MTSRIRVLALSPIPEEGAGCRFRIAQFIPYLRSVNIDVTLRSLFTAEFFNLVYQRGHYVRKASGFAKLALKHLASLRDLGQFDVLFLYREMLPIGPALVERLLAMRARPPVIFDFDDAIFLPSVSDANRPIAALKQPGKVATIIRHSNRVIAGNVALITVPDSESYEQWRFESRNLTTGNINWTAPQGNYYNGWPVVCANTVFLRDGDHIRGFNVADGAPRLSGDGAPQALASKGRVAGP